MVNPTVNKDESMPQEDAMEEKHREVSRFSYPYYDLNIALEVARTLYNQTGSKASFAQLASYLGHKDESSGAFIAKIWAAKQFGLVKIESQNASITTLGEKLAALQPSIRRDLRLAEAFLNVALFREVYKRFENLTLPSAKEGLLNILENTFGVPAKRSPVALKVLLASADQAGFRRIDPNRLIHPVHARMIEKEDSTNTRPQSTIAPTQSFSEATQVEDMDGFKCPVKTVQLKSGGTFSYSLSVDLTSLSVEDRKWLFELIDKLNEYRQISTDEKEKSISIP